MLEYMSLDERKGGSIDDPSEEARVLFNLSAQLVAVIAADFIDGIDLDMQQSMGRDLEICPELTHALLKHVHAKMGPEFTEDFTEEMRFLVEIVQGLMKCGHVAQIVKLRIECELGDYSI